MPETYVDDATVESVMLDLMSQQVEIIQGFHPRIRERYLDDLRATVRRALIRAFDSEKRARA